MRRPHPRTRQSGDHARLSWPGRVWERGAALQSPAPRIVTTELPGDARETRGRRVAHAARLVKGDALDVATALALEGLAGKVDLVYVDPPFGARRVRGDDPARAHAARPGDRE